MENLDIRPIPYLVTPLSCFTIEDVPHWERFLNVCNITHNTLHQKENPIIICTVLQSEVHIAI